MLQPGPAHPHRPRPAADLAERLGVDAAAVEAWCDAGLAVDGDGLIDPFAAANWLCWHGLDQCPVLARHWRRYLAWFRPHIQGRDVARQVTVQRHHRCYLPRPAARVTWWLPQLTDTLGQRVVARPSLPGPVAGLADALGDDGRFMRLSWAAPGRTPAVQACDVVDCVPLPPRPDVQVARVMAELIAEFRYVYRHHAPQDLQEPVRMEGSCFDLSRAFGQRLSDLGRPWRLLAGVVADDRLANPHFWLEVEGVDGWFPADPTLPAIARMLGEDPTPWLAAYATGSDARRIALGVVGAPAADLPVPPAVASCLGEVVADGVSAWACLDWVCGECSWTFTGP